MSIALIAISVVALGGLVVILASAAQDLRKQD